MFHQVLTGLNLRYVRQRKDRLSERFRFKISDDTFRKSAEYTVEKERFSIVSRTAEAVFLLTIILTGTFGSLELLLLRADLPPRIHGILYIFIISLLFQLFSLPFSAYSQFVIEKRYDFNTMRAGLFFFDLGKSLIISAIIFFPLLYGLFFLVDAAGMYWWIIAFGGIAIFQLIMNVLYPILIAPLFNKFTPLEPGPLRDRLIRLAQRLDFKTKGIFIMDGSKRSRHSNAFFTGIGSVKRIILFDTLINDLSEEEVEAVLAHEIGHERKKHTLKMFLVSTLLLFIGLYVIHLLLHWQPLFAAFGFLGPSLHGIVIILSLCAGPLTFIVKPLLTAWSRRFEYQADEFAVRKADTGQALVSGLIQLHKKNLSNLTPHPLYSFYHYSHPTINERIDFIDSL